MLVSSTVVAFPNGGWNVARLDVILLFGNLAILTAGAGRLTLPILMGKPEFDIETTIVAKIRNRSSN